MRIAVSVESDGGMIERCAADAFTPIAQRVAEPAPAARVPVMPAPQARA